jgi:hypothetical protein
MSVFQDLIPEAIPSQKCDMQRIYGYLKCSMHGHIHRQARAPVALQLPNSGCSQFVQSHVSFIPLNCEHAVVTACLISAVNKHQGQ